MRALAASSSRERDAALPSASPSSPVSLAISASLSRTFASSASLASLRASAPLPSSSAIRLSASSSCLLASESSLSRESDLSLAPPSWSFASERLFFSDRISPCSDSTLLEPPCTSASSRLISLLRPSFSPLTLSTSRAASSRSPFPLSSILLASSSSSSSALTLASLDALKSSILCFVSSDTFFASSAALIRSSSLAAFTLEAASCCISFRICSILASSSCLRASSSSSRCFSISLYLLFASRTWSSISFWCFFFSSSIWLPPAPSSFLTVSLKASIRALNSFLICSNSFACASFVF
mmetsp:Transcript_15625/g.37882  ORF Transcript_15625/g.37882 Transcript_15625/m.37882 type:complete len:298 (+) Transcript_15625:136-1029(+)